MPMLFASDFVTVSGQCIITFIFQHPYPGQILLLRGNLAKSISRKVTNGSVVIGTNVKYARIHQLGGQAGRGHKAQMPARPYLPFVGNRLQHGVQKNLLQIAMNYLAKPIR